jgi:hypothetical protein
VNLHHGAFRLSEVLLQISFEDNYTKTEIDLKVDIGVDLGIDIGEEFQKLPQKLFLVQNIPHKLFFLFKHFLRNYFFVQTVLQKLCNDRY